MGQRIMLSHSFFPRWSKDMSHKDSAIDQQYAVSSVRHHQ
jgi:hypothetical protein